MVPIFSVLPLRQVHDLGSMAWFKNYIPAKSIVGEALLDNRRLVDLVNEFGFEVSPMPGDNLTLRLHLDLAKGENQSRT